MKPFAVATSVSASTKYLFMIACWSTRKHEPAAMCLSSGYSDHWVQFGDSLQQLVTVRKLLMGPPRQVLMVHMHVLLPDGPTRARNQTHAKRNLTCTCRGRCTLAMCISGSRPGQSTVSALPRLFVDYKCSGRPMHPRGCGKQNSIRSTSRIGLTIEVHVGQRTGTCGTH